MSSWTVPFRNATERVQNFLTTVGDGDTPDDSEHMKLLRNYYGEDEVGMTRPRPNWLPPDPKAAVRAAPVSMVSSSSVQPSSYGIPQQRQSETNSLRSRPEVGPTGYSSSSKASFIDSLPRNSQPVAAAPAASLSSAAKLKARYNRGTGTSTPTQNTPPSTSSNSLRAQNSFDDPVGGRDDRRSGASGNYSWDQPSGRSAHAPAPPAAPVASANSPWSGGGDEYNGFSSYSSSSPFGDSGRSGGGMNRQAGQRNGLVRGPRGM